MWYNIVYMFINNIEDKSFQVCLLTNTIGQITCLNNIN